MPNDYKTSYDHLHLIDEMLSTYCTGPLRAFFHGGKGSQVGEVTCIARVIRLSI